MAVSFFFNILSNFENNSSLAPYRWSLGYNDIRNAQHLNRVTTFGLLAMDAWVFDR